MDADALLMEALADVLRAGSDLEKGNDSEESS